MKVILHKGNTEGPNPETENAPETIICVLKEGFDVEVDVWFPWCLGHDNPTYEVDLEFLRQPGLWAHAKNLAALRRLLDERIHCFYHEEDPYTLTSLGFIWTYPGFGATARSVIVARGEDDYRRVIDENIAYGVCTDYR